MTLQKFIKYTLLNSDGKVLNSDLELTLKVSESAGNYLVHKNLLKYLKSRRQGTFSTKTRSEVRGGGRKPWQQKGTGRARAGSSRSPLWRGGGVTFGPKPKIMVVKLNKKERKLALQTLLYNRRRNILVIKDLENCLIEGRTKNFLKVCTDCQVNLKQKLLVIVSKKIPSLKFSVQNLKNVELITASNLNTLSLLKANQIIITPSAIENIQEIYCDQT